MKLDQAILKIMEGFEVPYESISPSYRNTRPYSDTTGGLKTGVFDTPWHPKDS